MSVQYILKGTPDRIMARLKELSLVTDVPGQITRTFVSPASMKAAALVGQLDEGSRHEHLHRCSRQRPRTP